MCVIQLLCTNMTDSSSDEEIKKEGEFDEFFGADTDSGDGGGATTLRTLVGGLRPRTYEELRPVLMPFCEMLMRGRPSKEICPGVLDNYGPLVSSLMHRENYIKLLNSW